jgi:hypothetical protein
MKKINIWYQSIKENGHPPKGWEIVRRIEALKESVKNPDPYEKINISISSVEGDEFVEWLEEFTRDFRPPAEVCIEVRGFTGSFIKIKDFNSATHTLRQKVAILAKRDGIKLV